MTETSAILRLAEQADEAIEQCEFCGLRGHRVKDCPAYVEYLKGFEKPKSNRMAWLVILFVLACGFVGGAVWERMIK